MITDMQQAWHLYKSGNTNDALKVIEAICQSDNIDADSAYLYGCCLSQVGRRTEALSAFKQSLLYSPGEIRTYMAIGASLMEQDSLDEAASFYEKVLITEPSHLYAQVELAKIHAASDNFEAARKQLEKVSKHNPNSGLPFCELAKLGKKVSASVMDVHQHCLTAVNLEPEVAEYQFELGKCLLEQEKYDEARDCLDKANNLNPENPGVLSALASVSVKQGNMDFALEQMDKLQKQRAFIPLAALSFLLCCKYKNRCDEAIEYAQTCLLDKDINQNNKRNIHSKLASVLDQKKQYDQAWQHLVASKNTQVSLERYNPVGHKAYIDNLIETFNFANMFNMARGAIKQQISPIFIIGMPRSGSSLVEQILAAHPEVTGGGELLHIQNIIYDLPKITGSTQAWPICVLDLKQQNTDLLASRYLNDVAQLAGNTQYVTDKMPHNFYYIGLIKLLFPLAKIIHCRRHPLDTCISIYFQNFKEGHAYSNNLFNLGTHYHQYQRVMQHWKSLAFDMFEINYEELVQDPEQAIRKMLDYCNLDWNDRCLSFNKVKRYVLTASFDQVRQPIHTRSVNRWKHYEPYLDELNKGLERGF